MLQIGPLLLVLAFLPSLLYVGHWSELVNYAMGHPGVEEVTDIEEHAGHCHIGPATCSEQPAPASVSVIPLLIDLPEPELQMTALEEIISILNEIVVAPAKEPPRL